MHVRVTYAHKKRRVQKHFSSPLEVLPLEAADLTRTQMAHRMLKRSRRVALEDKEHLAKRTKHTSIGFETPFSSPFEHESVIRRPLVPEPLSPVPVPKRVGASSRNLKKNTSRPLASPFCSRPSSAASSPRGRSSHRTSRRPLHAKSRAVSAICKENVRPVSCLKDYMRSRSAQDDRFATLDTFSYTLDDREDLSPGGVVHSNASFYVDKPLSYSTPAKHRPRKLMEHCHAEVDDFFGSFLRNDPTDGGALRVSVGETQIGLPGTSPAQGANLIIRAGGNLGVSTPTFSPREIGCPQSPGSDLALELGSMSICGDPETQLDQETHRPSTSIPRDCLQDTSALTQSIAKKAVVRRPTRDRARTIRASDFAKLGVSSVSPKLIASSHSNVRRTRSGTVVGPDSKLAANKTGLLLRPSKVTPATGLAAVQSGSESESDDELLLKAAWIEDMEYLGLAPQSKIESGHDELNLGLCSSWHGLESTSAPPRRLGLTRRRR